MNRKHFLTTLLAAPLAFVAGLKAKLVKPKPVVLCFLEVRDLFTHPSVVPTPRMLKLREILDSGNYRVYDWVTGKTYPTLAMAELNRRLKILAHTQNMSIRAEGWDSEQEITVVTMCKVNR